MEVGDLELFIEDFFTVFAGSYPNFYYLVFYPEEYSVTGKQEACIRCYFSSGIKMLWSKEKRTFTPDGKANCVKKETFSCLAFEKALDAYCRLFTGCTYDKLDSCYILDEKICFESYQDFIYYEWNEETDLIETR